jgi:mono/diheme cytochrome c family protein
MGAHITASLFVLAFVIVSPVTAGAQFPPGSGAGKPQTVAEQGGEAFFVKTCLLCHGPTTGQARVLKLGASDLMGLYKRPGITEEYVRQRIAEGVPGRMPGYKYTYTPAQLESLLAYLKIR